jgi:prepilin-type N-terminal cleavage/methylation domain-containing protein
MNRWLRHLSLQDSERGFTLMELVLVIVIVGLTLGVTIVRLGTFDFWKEQSTVRRLSELVVFLNNQAVMDQAFYRLEFDLESRSYRVGVMRVENSMASTPTGINLPPLKLELAALLSPSLDGDSTMIPPPSFPSLAEPTELPPTIAFEDIVTPRGKVTPDDKRENPFLLFSPRGASEFGVIHLATADNRHVTILVNPWTGVAEVFPEYKDFQWTLGKEKK